MSSLCKLCFLAPVLICSKLFFFFIHPNATVDSVTTVSLQLRATPTAQVESQLKAKLNATHATCLSMHIQWTSLFHRFWVDNLGGECFIVYPQIYTIKKSNCVRNICQRLKRKKTSVLFIDNKKDQGSFLEDGNEGYIWNDYINTLRGRSDDVAVMKTRFRKF